LAILSAEKPKVEFAQGMYHKIEEGEALIAAIVPRPSSVLASAAHRPVHTRAEMDVCQMPI
jgi:hypothetical protein